MAYGHSMALKLLDEPFPISRTVYYSEHADSINERLVKNEIAFRHELGQHIFAILKLRRAKIGAVRKQSNHLVDFPHEFVSRLAIVIGNVSTNLVEVGISFESAKNARHQGEFAGYLASMRWINSSTSHSSSSPRSAWSKATCSLRRS